MKRKEAVKVLRESEKGDKLEMKLIPTTETEKEHVIESLKLKNSAWYEGISSRILKYSKQAITKPLSHICNAYLNQDIYPDRLKLAIVHLIYKKGEENWCS